VVEIEKIYRMMETAFPGIEEPLN